MGVLICKKMKNSKLILVLVVGIVAVGGYMLSTLSSSENFDLVGEAKAVVYRSSSCGCCSNYIGYLKRNGIEVEDAKTDDMSLVKEEHNIPGDMESCHTMMIDGYVFEGHIPLEAVQKVLAEKPDIQGIAMPGMPSGSPGMPGAKSTLMVHAMNNDGGTSLFMEL